MDRGQIFIGKRLEVDSHKALNQELNRYGYEWNPRKREARRIDRQPIEYKVYWNNETNPIGDGCIFGIEALAAYVNCREYAAQHRVMLGTEMGILPNGGERDWIQEISLDKLAEELDRVRRDIPDAMLLLMDLHY